MKKRYLVLGVIFLASIVSLVTKGLPSIKAPISEKAHTPVGTKSMGAFKCEGKVRCQEMNSCSEAKFYLVNCPNVEIDGDGDGQPCEEQLCGH